MNDVEHQRFLAAIPGSWKAVWVVGMYLHARGDRKILIGALKLRPQGEDVAEYGDSHDLEVQMDEGETQWWRVEIKGRELAFTCCDDYPYDTIFVDRVEKADATEPYGYFIVNRALTHAAIIKTSTKEHWIKKTVKDTKKTREYPVFLYECPKGLAKFVQMA